ncbi:MAG: hypothetical protein PHT07_23960 [Paludibacter sp.]|nr:hypothetical protein [Paludibacter sp.]
MSYYVITQGRGNITLFLVDRHKTKRQWWCTDLSLAMAFDKYSAAQYSADRLRYKHPDVVDFETARELERENMHNEVINSEHPFSSEALGQWDD